MGVQTMQLLYKLSTNGLHSASLECTVQLSYGDLPGELAMPLFGLPAEVLLLPVAAGTEEALLLPAAGGAVTEPVSVEGEPGAGLDELMAAPSEAAMYAAAAAAAASTGGEAPASELGLRETHHSKQDALPNWHVKPGWASAAPHILSPHDAAASCHVTT